MRLYVNGQDINHLILADIDNEKSLQTFEAEPEQFLLALNTFLSAQSQSSKDIKEIYAVIGSGSATALRSSLSIVNTIAFVAQIPLKGIEKSPADDDSKILSLIRNDEIKIVASGSKLMPEYQEPAKITISKKDQLKRAT